VRAFTVQVDSLLGVRMELFYQFLSRSWRRSVKDLFLTTSVGNKTFREEGGKGQHKAIRTISTTLTISIQREGEGYQQVSHILARVVDLGPRRLANSETISPSSQARRSRWKSGQQVSEVIPKLTLTPHSPQRSKKPSERGFLHGIWAMRMLRKTVQNRKVQETARGDF
jgi:hypothetical protein